MDASQENGNKDLIGPIEGGTVVDVWGQQFEKNKNITIMFGDKPATKVKYVSKNHLVTESPSVPSPGDVKISIKYEGTRF